MKEKYELVRERLLFSLLLTGEANQDPEFREELCSTLNLDGTSYVTILFSFDDLWPLPYGGSKEAPEEYILKMVECLQSTIKNAAASNFPIVTARFKNDMLCIIKFYDPPDEMDSSISMALQHFAGDIIKRMHDNYNDEISSFISQTYSDILTTYLAYDEASRRRRIYAFSNKRRVVCRCVPDSAEQEDEFFGTVKGLEGELFYFIRTRKFDKARLAAVEYVNIRFAGAVISFNSYFFHVERFIYELIQAFESMLPPASKDVLAELKLHERFTSFDSVSDLLDRLNNTIDKIEYLEKSSSANYPWMEQMLEYINKNFTDPNLNASTVSNHCGKNPSYISRVFSREIGCGLYEYIQKLRIAKAKSLIGRSQPLNKIAQESGFPSTIAMNRAFTRYEHSLPREFYIES